MCARDLEDLNVDLEFRGFPLLCRDFLYHFCYYLETGTRMVAEHRGVCAELDQSVDPLRGNCKESCAVLAAVESLICVEEGQNEPMHSPGADAGGGATTSHCMCEPSGSQTS